MVAVKSLIAYFSRKGANYVNGSIQNLEVGNTEVAAAMIQKITGSDMFQIEGKTLSKGLYGNHRSS